MQRRFGKEDAELEYKILSIQHLAEVAESIASIRVELDINELCSTLTDMFLEAVEQNPGKTTLQFAIVDRQDGVRLTLKSKKYQVSPSADFMDFLNNNELNYFINV